MQSCPPVLRRLLARVAAEIRLRRAERGAWRGAFWGAVLAAFMVATQDWEWPAWIGAAAQVAALAVLAGASVIGALSGGMRHVPVLAAARLADRAFGLKDRVTTALEVLALPPGGSLLAASQLADTVAQVERIDIRRSVLPRVLPREARLLLWPLATILVLLLLPPLPAPAALVQAVTPDHAERAVSLLDRAKLLGKTLLPPQQPRQPELQRSLGEPQPAANPSSEFKDTSLSRQRAALDFASFAKKGDERLRLLDRADKLPDLQSDFATSQYRSMARKLQDLATAQGGKLSEAKLNQVLKEMDKLGRKDDKDAEWSDDIANAAQSLEDGDSEGAMEDLQQALGKMRDAEERQRASRMLQGGRDGTPDRNGDGGENGDTARQRRDAGFSQGKGGGPSQGTPSARLRSTPYDAAISGARRGRAPSFDTQMSSRPGSLRAQLQYRGEIGQYRRQMEDAIAREQVPRDYHDQIRDYFKSLQEQ